MMPAGLRGPMLAKVVAGTSRQPGQRWARLPGRVTNAFGLVLLLVLLTYVLGSVTSYRGWTGVVTIAVAVTSATVGLATARASHVSVRWAGRLALLSIALAASSAASGAGWPLGLSAVLQVLLLTAAAASILRAVVTESEVGFRTILGAVSVYLMLAILFTFLYVAVERLQPGPFFGPNAHLGTGDFLFFSITTITTTGYGNLVPAAQPGKMFAGLEMFIGQVFVVTLIAGLVSLWRPGEWARKRREESSGSDDVARPRRA